ncbi:MAG: amidohydrolase family protein [Acidobacteriota bacterium]|nr:amidohydrolase family protein [Acidobacteriota bacterium]
MRIDSHHHFWKYQREEYGWLDESMKAIRRDFLPAQLKSEIEAARIDGVVSVQVRQTVEETTWLLELAGANPFIRGVVGWAPLLDRKVADVLEPLAGNPKLRSLRHIIQGEPDDNFILRGDFNVGITVLSHFNLAYDILIYERHLPQTIRFVDLHPNQTFILDHIAKPRIKDREISPWHENITELAKRGNVYCKLSGMVTEADHQHWTPSDLDPYFDTAIEAFGSERLMFGSDWPVCLVATSYSAWFNLVAKKIARLSSHERARILGDTALEAYGL